MQTCRPFMNIRIEWEQYFIFEVQYCESSVAALQPSWLTEIPTLMSTATTRIRLALYLGLYDNRVLANLGNTKCELFQREWTPRQPWTTSGRTASTLSSAAAWQSPWATTRTLLVLPRQQTETRPVLTC